VNEPWWIDTIKAFLIVNIVLGAFAYSTWLERKLLGRMQLRYGPNRAGPFGLLQPIADLVKLIRKESFFPTHAVELLYFAAPVVAGMTALAAFSVIPFGGVWHWGPYDVSGRVVDVSIGLLLLFALGVCLVNFPVLAIFNRPAGEGGVPVLYLYLFGVWVAGIAAVAILARSRWDDEE
jgi:NADH-quinone oxidoreductase subunit H